MTEFIGKTISLGRVLLDTNVVSERNKPSPSPQVMNFLRDLDEQQTFISSVTVAELERGIHLLQNRESVRAQRLRLWLDTVLLPQFAERILPFDTPVALRWGQLTGTEAARRQPPAILDSMLAATASSHGLTLITRNTSDFLSLNIAVFNPWNE